MRFTVYDVNNKAVGEFTAPASVTWTLGGNPTVSPGGSAMVNIPEEIAAKEWMQLGYLVATQPHADLPIWAGVIDTPWEATQPVSVTAYSIEYLLSLRMPDAESLVTGNAAAIMSRMIDLANANQDMFLRVGNVGSINAVNRQETIKQASLWDQLQKFALRTCTEFIARAGVENGRLMIYFDFASLHGTATNYLLHDGDSGNMNITGATVEGEIWNRVTGVGAQSTTSSRLQSPAQVDADSATKQRLRSIVKQFDVKTDAALLSNAKTFLAAYKNPYMKIKAKVINSRGVFSLLRLGNTFVTQSSQMRLPAGRRGWKGLTRICAMTYNDSDQSVALTLTGVYDG